MSNRETILFEADEVEAGQMSIYECEYPDEVLDEIGYYEFDADGYIIEQRMNWNNANTDYNSNNQQKEEDKNNGKTCCGICFLLFIIFLLFSIINYHPAGYWYFKLNYKVTFNKNN